MLILTRKGGQAIVIGGAITITVTAISGKVVKLGIDAPRDIPVRRSELCRTIRASTPDLPVHQQ
jgi:carbon storage regulator